MARAPRAAFALLALALVGCSGDPLVVRRLPEPVRVEAAKVVDGNSAFACDLYRQLRGARGNLFFSPFSISTALTMTYAGARGATADEMAAVLHLPLGPERLHPVFHELLKSLDRGTASGRYRLDVANRLWGQTGQGFLPAYRALTRDQYLAPLDTLDFIGQSEAARARINGWIAQRTQGKIEDLLPPGSIDRTTRLVLTNAIYFKGKWQTRFDARNTRPGAFYVSADRKVSVPMMEQTAEVGVGSAGRVEVLEIPYAGRDLSLLIVMPGRRDSLSALEDSLSPARLELWRAALRTGQVDVELPRFAVTSSFALKRTLGELGMPTAFGAAADFSGMNGAHNLFVVDALHRAFVSVNEEGTEAAAATSVHVGRLAMTRGIRIDHPFLFLIRDNVTGSILFMGRIVDPTAGG